MIDWQGFGSRLGSDGEFAVASRLWTATVRLDVGDRSHAVRIEEGRVADVAEVGGDAPCDVFVSAPADVWEKMLRPVPPPFYQDLFPASLHHGLVMNADMLEFAAYYPALRRLVEVMREARAVS